MIKNKKYICLIFLFCLLTSGCALSNSSLSQDAKIKSFSDCTKYYPIFESSPRQCKLPDGTVFAEMSVENNKKSSAASPFCHNSCGDGICNNTICLASDCACPETEKNCPKDCGATKDNKNNSTKSIGK